MKDKFEPTLEEEEQRVAQLILEKEVEVIERLSLKWPPEGAALTINTAESNTLGSYVNRVPTVMGGTEDDLYIFPMLISETQRFKTSVTQAVLARLIQWNSAINSNLSLTELLDYEDEKIKTMSQSDPRLEKLYKIFNTISHSLFSNYGKMYLEGTNDKDKASFDRNMIGLFLLEKPENITMILDKLCGENSKNPMFRYLPSLMGAGIAYLLNTKYPQDKNTVFYLRDEISGKDITKMTDEEFNPVNRYRGIIKDLDLKVKDLDLI